MLEEIAHHMRFFLQHVCVRGDEFPQWRDRALIDAIEVALYAAAKGKRSGPAAAPRWLTETGLPGLRSASWLVGVAIGDKVGQEFAAAGVNFVRRQRVAAGLASIHDDDRCALFGSASHKPKTAHHGQ